MAMFAPGSVKRKDLEVVYDRQPDSSLFSETKRIRISMDGEAPLILEEEEEEEAVMSSRAVEAQLQVDGLPQGNRNLMTSTVDEMPIDGEVATAAAPWIAPSLDPVEIHEREETGAEDPMEVEEEEEEGLLRRPGRTAPAVIWILLRKDRFTQLPVDYGRNENNNSSCNKGVGSIPIQRAGMGKKKNVKS
ncbi:hypothetical protein MUK42_08021 [Musa troglodytarum]|uniref:Uncharacterized protein n=1 Tax=Musa troglodytarum TaxID=320322 RepID=A0A9E7KW41_9LILI|nr:hypothetical protein MUK42_08021 [Musa troglodytarum]